MINLKKAIDVWPTPAFKQTLKQELEKMGVDELPLQQGLSSSSIALDSNLQVILLTTAQSATHVLVTAGIFYSGIISGCACADDPTPPSEQNEYCEVLLDIDAITGMATVVLQT